MRKAGTGILVVSLLSALCAAGCSSAPADILMGPYATRVSQTEARVSWVTDSNVVGGSLSLVDAPQGRGSEWRRV
jgi:hypothetical protein